MFDRVCVCVCVCARAHSLHSVMQSSMQGQGRLRELGSERHFICVTQSKESFYPHLSLSVLH